MPLVDVRIDLDAAAEQIVRRREAWKQRGINVGDLTWREVGEGWPYELKTLRSDVQDADSVGVALSKGKQEGSLVLFQGGWADLLYWNGEDEEVVDEAPGWEDWLTVDAFGDLLDRLGGYFK
jgi:hypothetical protein